MEYYIKEINRTIKLDDELVREYIKYNDIIDSMFLVPIYIKYGENITQNVVSDKELSIFCNETLFGELEVMTILPQVLEYIEAHHKEWTDHHLQEISMDEI